MLVIRLLMFCIISFFLVRKDIKEMILPDVYLIILFSCLLIFDIMFNREYIVFGGIGFLTAGVFFLTVYYMSGKKIGFGDVKYAAVLGYFLGIPAWVIAIILACIIAIIFFCFGIKIFNWNKTKKIPFGPFLAGGSIIVSLWSVL